MNSWDTVLEESAAEVLGSMCFAAPEYRGSGHLADAAGAAISFGGEVEGTLKLVLEQDLAKQLAADFLGTDSDEVTAEQTRLFTLELANVICGTALAGIAPGRHYHLGLPEPIAADGEYQCCFSVAGEAIDLGLALELRN